MPVSECVSDLQNDASRLLAILRENKVLNLPIDPNRNDFIPAIKVEKKSGQELREFL